jgi:transitional endoplasmic reticulum ATPase
VNEQLSVQNSLEELGIYFESVPPRVWDDIAGLTNEKKLIESSIVLPLQHPAAALKHGVMPPKAILLFGPPGTGKTFFAKGIAGRLGWSLAEVSPSSLLGEGLEKQALKLKWLFERLLQITQAVIFLDEFEELALRPDVASEHEKMVSSEMLRQIPRLREAQDVLLICATNNIRLLNPALLRPGRFDNILPIGPLDAASRKDIFRMYLSRMNVGEIDLTLISSRTRYYTPADIQEVCRRAALNAFEKEIAEKVEH